MLLRIRRFFQDSPKKRDQKSFRRAFGAPLTNTTARTETHDKRHWHKRLRAGERGELASVGPETDHVAFHRNAVSSTWDMAKDGKYWFGPSRQLAAAERIAARRTRLPPERKALRALCWPSGVLNSSSHLASFC